MQAYPGIILMGGVGYDSNIYLIDGEVLIDTGTGIFFNEMREEMGYRFDIRKIKTIVNTHCHFDHAGGNKKFRDWLKLEIAIHEADKKSLETGKGTLSELFGQGARSVTVDRALKGGNKIKTENFTFDVIHTPGHTPGSICLYEKKKKILISGDTLFSDGIGRTDLPGGNANEIKASLKKLMKNHIEYLLPGHGMPKIGGVTFLIKQLVANPILNEAP